MDSIAGLKRTHNCNDLGRANLNEEVVLMGWVLRRRDHGGVIFIDLRDRWGITQVVFNPEINGEVHAKAHGLRSEWVLAVRGRVESRPEGMTNPNLKTGEIEVLVDELRILNTSKTPPFPLDEEIEVADTLRLKYRYLDLRRPAMAENLILRHKACQAIRTYLNDNNFLEIETPVLTKSTPEGARDYLVPSRVNAGRFFALPQSPQLFKQLLMMAGMDRYYQIVKCFRDEDLRADRQPEFTQIDMELSFVEEEEIVSLERRVDAASVQGDPRGRAQTALSPHDLRRGHEPLRQRSARYPLRLRAYRFDRTAQKLRFQGLPGHHRRRRRGQMHQCQGLRRIFQKGSRRHDLLCRPVRGQGHGLGQDQGRRRMAVADRQVFHRRGAGCHGRCP